MSYQVAERTHTAISSPHGARIRVDVWRRGEQIASVADGGIIGGSVTDKWASGIRRTLSLTVPGTKQWRQWLTLGVELRPYRGVDFGGPGGVEMCPLGVFPVLKAARPRGADNLSVSASDRWQRVIDNTLLNTVTAPGGATIAQAIAQLIAGADVGAPVSNLATSAAPMPVVVWDKERHNTIIDLAKSISAEVFIDREGIPIIRNRVLPATPVITVRTGHGGNAIELSEDIDYTYVFNAVAVSSSNTDVVFDPVILSISDPADPAHRSQIGATRPMKYSSPLFQNRFQALAAAYTLLAKGAAPARQWSIKCPVDPALDAGDTINVENAEGDLEVCQIESVTIPLTGKDAQSITTFSTREDE